MSGPPDTSGAQLTGGVGTQVCDRGHAVSGKGMRESLKVSSVCLLLFVRLFDDIQEQGIQKCTLFSSTTSFVQG